MTNDGHSLWHALYHEYYVKEMANKLFYPCSLFRQASGSADAALPAAGAVAAAVLAWAARALLLGLGRLLAGLEAVLGLLLARLLVPESFFLDEDQGLKEKGEISRTLLRSSCCRLSRICRGCCCQPVAGSRRIAGRNLRINVQCISSLYS